MLTTVALMLCIAHAQAAWFTDNWKGTPGHWKAKEKAMEQHQKRWGGKQ